MRALLRPLLPLLLLASVACAGGRAGRTSSDAPPATTLRVENLAWEDMTVYVLRGAQRVRLGRVTGNSTGTLRIPDNLVFGVSSLRFLADPLGGSRTPISQEIAVRAGDQIRLLIPNY